MKTVSKPGKPAIPENEMEWLFPVQSSPVQSTGI